MILGGVISSFAVLYHLLGVSEELFIQSLVLSGQVPTLIDYRGSSTSSWGFQVGEPSSSYIGAIKELLDPDLPKPRHYLANEQLKSFPPCEMKEKRPMDIAFDYIMTVYEHAIQTAVSDHSSDYIGWVPKHLVLSIPAVWSDKRKDIILNARLLRPLSGCYH